MSVENLPIEFALKLFPFSNLKTKNEEMNQMRKLFIINACRGKNYDYEMPSSDPHERPGCFKLKVRRPYRPTPENVVPTGVGGDPGPARGGSDGASPGRRS